MVRYTWSDTHGQIHVVRYTWSDTRDQGHVICSDWSRSFNCHGGSDTGCPKIAFVKKCGTLFLPAPLLPNELDTCIKLTCDGRFGHSEKKKKTTVELGGQKTDPVLTGVWPPRGSRSRRVSKYWGTNEWACGSWACLRYPELPGFWVPRFSGYHCTSHKIEYEK